MPSRRSARTAALTANGKVVSLDTNRVEWRGDRRSSRLGGATDTDNDLAPHPKRARTEESTTSGGGSARAVSVCAPGIAHEEGSGLKIKIQGAAAIRPTEVAIEQLKGKKKSKYWFYAVEPAAITPSGLSERTVSMPIPRLNGHAADGAYGTNRSGSSGTGVDSYGGHSVSPGSTSDG
jgi:hypothetical protein